MARLYRQSSLATMFVQAEVRAEIDGQPHDPSADHVFMAFTALGVDPAPGDWHAGQWEVETSGPLPSYLASCLVGPDGVTLTKGFYSVWVKTAEFPETPIIEAGTLEVY